ncbi:hypothetical protein F5877DRAFT_49479 [Lentinula edodes]|nr:hypothetical protein F5877DRAFT_49479 [Lentinula edodes]
MEFYLSSTSIYAQSWTRRLGSYDIADPYPLCGTRHDIVERKYQTDSDGKGYISVYEYQLNGHTIMMDKNSGFILWTSLWKVDVIGMLDSYPDRSQVMRIIRDGVEAIQGTWLAYEVRQGGWNVKEDLTPLFG